MLSFVVVPLGPGILREMDTATADSRIIQRTFDLCEAIVEQPDFQELKKSIDSFMDDEMLKFQYQQVSELAQLLQMKQSEGLEVKPEEVGHFEALREEFLKNPTAQGFLAAQQQMQELHQTVGRILDKTFELGRKPQFDDLDNGCGSGCGCH
jgi:cell fate (sporulation/competence/biofilm development) regulator YlbF (YheA/YmcA/DUF963 family)